MGFIPALIPVVISASKVNSNANSDADTDLMAHTTRKKSIVNRLCSGPGAPISHWSDQHLERMIKTNNVMKEFEAELRQSCRPQEVTASEYAHWRNRPHL